MKYNKEMCHFRKYSRNLILILYTQYYMNQETLLVALFFLFMIGAGIGFYIARMIFA